MSHKAILLSTLFLILTVTFISFFHSVPKPFTLDETMMIRAFGKLNTMGPKAFHPGYEGGGGEELSHPLLYDYMNAIIVKFFGPSEIVLRGTGAIFFFLTLFILLYFVYLIFKKNRDELKIALFITSTLYLINPLIIQQSIIIIGDNNIFTFFFVLFSCLFYKYESLSGKGFILSRFKLAACLTVLFLIKEVTPIFLSVG